MLSKYAESGSTQKSKGVDLMEIVTPPERIVNTGRRVSRKFAQAELTTARRIYQSNRRFKWHELLRKSL
ncbi:MAG: hypothetical protein JNL58_31990 [Planctomyces sp.]|nr:hypothetical protein [Planctomyces sp.]